MAKTAPAWCDAWRRPYASSTCLTLWRAPQANLLRYAADEAKGKLDKTLDVSDWKQLAPDNIPEQKNGCDCGVFMVKFADWLVCNPLHGSCVEVLSCVACKLTQHFAFRRGRWTGHSRKKTCLTFASASLRR